MTDYSSMKVGELRKMAEDAGWPAKKVTKAVLVDFFQQRELTTNHAKEG